MKTPNLAARAQCHVVSNTHWDREWRFSMQKVRHRLVYMLDQLFDILERDPDYHSFHLDSQTVPLQDYLEIRPERRELLARMVRERRLYVGPWFCLPDENCVGGEAIIRNLQLGHRMAREMGHVSKTGYSPFSWGQISQMPQIYKGFGIEFAAFYRGINTRVAPRSEFFWEGPDGTRILASRLSRRPRYNIYYIIQRAVYWGVENTDFKHEQWSNGHGAWRMTSLEFGDRDYDYLHPGFGYHRELLSAKAQQAMTEQDDDWTTPHRFWSIGHDASFADIRETDMIRDCAEALREQADVFHSSLEQFQQGLLESAAADLPVLHGEMRYPSTDKDYSPLLGWVTSARTYIKQANFRAERNLMAYAEPLAFFAHLVGAPYPDGFLRTAFNWVLQNHGHDSIGGCSRDIIHEDMLYRYRQADEISRCVMEEAMLEICRGIDFAGWSPQDVAVVAYNPHSNRRSRVQPCLIDLPEHWSGHAFDLVDEQGAVLPMQAECIQPACYGLLNPQGDVPTTLLSRRYRAHVLWPDIPGYGYRTFRLAPRQTGAASEPSICTGPRDLANEYLSVNVNDNGTLRVTDKTTGKIYDHLGYFRNTSEAGNPWEHVAVPGDCPRTTRHLKAQVTVLENGPVSAALKVSLSWSIPRGLTDDRSQRSADEVPMEIVNIVRLSRGERWVAVETQLENRASNHYLQVCFPTGIQTPRIHVQTPFDVVERACRMSDPESYAEVPQNEHPMNSFIDRSDGRTGLALLNEGLKAYQAEEDEEATVSLSLLRCFSLLIWQTWKVSDYSAFDPGSQCPGPHRFRYAILPHAGNWESAGLWQAAEDFNLDLRTAQMSPAGAGPLKRSHSFMGVSPNTVHVSAIKRSESGQGWVVRLFNPGSTAVRARLRLNGGFAPPVNTGSPVERIQSSYRAATFDAAPWSAVRLVTLEEVPEQDLDLQPDGSIEVTLNPRQLKTVEFQS